MSYIVIKPAAVIQSNMLFEPQDVLAPGADARAYNTWVRGVFFLLEVFLTRAAISKPFSDYALK